MQDSDSACRRVAQSSSFSGEAPEIVRWRKVIVPIDLEQLMPNCARESWRQPAPERRSFFWVQLVLHFVSSFTCTFSFSSTCSTIWPFLSWGFTCKSSGCAAAWEKVFTFCSGNSLCSCLHGTVASKFSVCVPDCRCVHKKKWRRDDFWGFTFLRIQNDRCYKMIDCGSRFKGNFSNLTMWKSDHFIIPVHGRVHPIHSFFSPK